MIYASLFILTCKRVLTSSIGEVTAAATPPLKQALRICGRLQLHFVIGKVNLQLEKLVHLWRNWFASGEVTAATTPPLQQALRIYGLCLHGDVCAHTCSFAYISWILIIPLCKWAKSMGVCMKQQLCKYVFICVSFLIIPLCMWAIYVGVCMKQLCKHVFICVRFLIIPLCMWAISVVVCMKQLCKHICAFSLRTHWILIMQLTCQSNASPVSGRRAMGFCVLLLYIYGFI